jgi:hypothetical protein
MDWKNHGYRVGANQEWHDDLPTEDDALRSFAESSRKRIEPWLSAVFQGEHLNLLLGNGLTTAVGHLAGTPPPGMNTITFGTAYDSQINAHAAKVATAANRGDANIEDQIRSALALLEGLKVQNDAGADTVRDAINRVLLEFLKSILAGERGLAVDAAPDDRELAELHLQSFLMSFASRSASRERLNIFTTNYDRLVEHASDLAGLRIIDRFVGALNPVFRSSRVEVDVHYNPPGIRGEPRFLEGVVRLTKLHGSVDWYLDLENKSLRRRGIPFGAPENHTDIPVNPLETAMIYPNPAKDVETSEYPYAELFRDLASAICRPNSVLVTYGYGFGDDHINRVLEDMLTIPSTHLVIIGFEVDERLKKFCNKIGRKAQISLLVGPHFASLPNLVEYYLPKPAIDFITKRMTELLNNRITSDPDPTNHPASVTVDADIPALNAVFNIPEDAISSEES